MLLNKSNESLLEHIKNMVIVGGQVARETGIEDVLYKKVILACAFCDIGKATVEYQTYVHTNKEKYPYTLASFPFIFVAEGLMNPKWNIDVKQFRYEATAAVLSFQKSIDVDTYKDYSKPKYHTELYDLLQEIFSLQEVKLLKLPPASEFWNRIQPLLNVSPSAILDTVLTTGTQRYTLRYVLQNQNKQAVSIISDILHIAHKE